MVIVVSFVVGVAVGVFKDKIIDKAKGLFKSVKDKVLPPK